MIAFRMSDLRLCKSFRAEQAVKRCRPSQKKNFRNFCARLPCTKVIYIGMITTARSLAGRHRFRANPLRPLMKLSRTFGYALQATVVLSQYPPAMPVSARKLAARDHLPERYLLQILRRLVSHGVLKSAAGMLGGYYLSRPPHQISVLDIVDAIEQPLLIEIESQAGLNDFTRKRLQLSLATIVHGVRGQLQGLSLADLVEESPDQSCNPIRLKRERHSGILTGYEWTFRMIPGLPKYFRWTTGYVWRTVLLVRSS